jgi:hypothetical protein
MKLKERLESHSNYFLLKLYAIAKFPYVLFSEMRG